MAVTKKDETKPTRVKCRATTKSLAEALARFDDLPLIVSGLEDDEGFGLCVEQGRRSIGGGQHEPVVFVHAWTVDDFDADGGDDFLDLDGGDEGDDGE